MKQLYRTPGDFEAKITILTKKEGGRKTPPFNGIRWDLMYPEDEPEDGVYMIWPEFIDAKGDAISQDIPLEGTLNARMHILNQDLAEKLHSSRIKIGSTFYCVEGRKKVATGSVTKLTGLHARNEI